MGRALHAAHCRHAAAHRAARAARVARTGFPRAVVQGAVHGLPEHGSGCRLPRAGQPRPAAGNVDERDRQRRMER